MPPLLQTKDIHKLLFFRLLFSFTFPIHNTFFLYSLSIPLLFHFQRSSRLNSFVFVCSLLLFRRLVNSVCVSRVIYKMWNAKSTFFQTRENQFTKLNWVRSRMRCAEDRIKLSHRWRASLLKLRSSERHHLK